MDYLVTRNGVTEEQLLARKAQEARIAAAKDRVIGAAKDWARSTGGSVEKRLSEAVHKLRLAETESPEPGA
jgi:hypothetical protein